MVSATSWISLKGVVRVPGEYAVLRSDFGLWASMTMVATMFLEGTPARVRLDRQLIRSGERELPFDEIDTARIDAESLRLNKLQLIFGKKDEFEFGVDLRKGAEIVVSERTKELLAVVLAASSIEIPTDRYDPKGKFARSGSPFNITRDEAIELVRHPPLKGEPLPITL